MGEACEDSITTAQNASPEVVEVEEKPPVEACGMTQIMKGDEESNALAPKQQDSVATRIAKALAVSVVGKLAPYGVGYGALAATEGSVAAGEFLAAHIAAFKATVGATVAVARIYLYAVGGTVMFCAVPAVAGGVLLGIYQVVSSDLPSRCKLDNAETEALQAAWRLGTLRYNNKVDLATTVSTMEDHAEHPNVQIAGCLDVVHEAGNADFSTILESGVVQAIIQALETHWDDEQVLKTGSKALRALFDAASETEALQELGTDHALAKAMESLDVDAEDDAMDKAKERLDVGGGDLAIVELGESVETDNPIESFDSVEVKPIWCETDLDKID